MRSHQSVRAPALTSLYAYLCLCLRQRQRFTALNGECQARKQFLKRQQISRSFDGSKNLLQGGKKQVRWQRRSCDEDAVIICPGFESGRRLHQ